MVGYKLKQVDPVVKSLSRDWGAWGEIVGRVKVLRIVKNLLHELKQETSTVLLHSCLLGIDTES